MVLTQAKFERKQIGLICFVNCGIVGHYQLSKMVTTRHMLPFKFSFSDISKFYTCVDDISGTQ